LKNAAPLQFVGFTFQTAPVHGADTANVESVLIAGGASRNLAIRGLTFTGYRSGVLASNLCPSCS
jgi:hypothetical protein